MARKLCSLHHPTVVCPPISTHSSFLRHTDTDTNLRYNTLGKHHEAEGGWAELTLIWIRRVPFDGEAMTDAVEQLHMVALLVAREHLEGFYA